jgi:hypothetical protein
MRRMTLAVCSLVAALALAAAPAHAQVWIGGGVTLPSGDFGDFYTTGFAINAGVTAAKFSNDRARLWAEGLFGINNGDDAIEEDDLKSTMYGGFASLSYELVTTGTTRPYLIGGAGYLAQRISQGDFSQTEGGLGLNGGLGVTFGKFSVEGRYWTASINDGTTAFLMVQGGISF